MLLDEKHNIFTSQCCNTKIVNIFVQTEPEGQMSEQKFY